MHSQAKLVEKDAELASRQTRLTDMHRELSQLQRLLNQGARLSPQRRNAKSLADVGTFAGEVGTAQVSLSCNMGADMLSHAC